MRVQNLIPVTLELGGKSPNIFFADVMAEDDDFFDKASRASRCSRSTRARSAPARVARAGPGVDLRQVHGARRERTEEVKQGNPLDTATMIGAQASSEQLEKILSYIDIGKQEGAKVLTGGERATLPAATWPAATTSADRLRGPQQDAHLPGGDLRPGGVGDDLQGRGDALAIANDTLYGLGAGVWTRDINTRLSHRPRHPGRPRVDQLLPRCTRRTRPSAATSSRASAARPTR
jgi:aldehyde dehydrogenase